MNRNFRHRQLPAGNPLANALVVIVGALVIGVSFVLGVVAFVALAAAMLVLGAIVAIRVWWLNRRAVSQQKSQEKQPGSSAASPQVIEGEYRIVDPHRQQNGEP